MFAYHKDCDLSGIYFSIVCATDNLYQLKCYVTVSLYSDT